MKTYVLILSRTFPAYHPKAGQPTYFKEQLQNTLLDIAGVSACDCCKYETRNCDTCGHNAVNFRKKIHTIRANFGLWEKRIAEIQAGCACLSVREWTGRAYASKQVEIARLTAADGIGLDSFVGKTRKIGTRLPAGFDFTSDNIARNDGLSVEDWKDWFSNGAKYRKNKRMAIIHFTPFRYTK